MLELTKDEKEFLFEHREFLQNNDFKGFYDAAVTELSYDTMQQISNITDAFFDCGITAEDILKDLSVTPAFCFSNTGLKSVSLPDSIVRIDSGTFCGCKQLQSVGLSNNLQIIGNAAFMGCDKLVSIEFPDKLKSIGESSFATTGIEFLTIPKSVDAIGADCFWGSALREVKLPEKFRKVPLEEIGIYTSRTQITYY